MSEEILKALMQLFAIVAKQEEGGSNRHREYVLMFLKLQLSQDKIEEYVGLYDGFVGADEGKEKKALVSVKDSVKTLAICKKINKTLTQKQKAVVLVRLYEFIRVDNSLSNLRTELLETVSNVFNIATEERDEIFKFIFHSAENLKDSKNIYSLKIKKDHKHDNQLFDDNYIYFLKINSVDLYFIRYDGTNEVLLNGLLLNKKYIYLFAYGSTIKPAVGDAIYYSDIVGHFLAEQNNVELSFECKNLEFRFGGKKVALRDIDLEEGPGKLIAIMGASGAGKTTLLNVLAGLEKPYTGEVKVNGINIHLDKKKLEGVIGYIPQDDILIEELSVFQNLYYNAKLCFSNLPEKNLIEKVDKTLANLGLLEIKHIKVGNVLDKKISGGQRKRLNIALELIREPSVLFVDEPTSGLSSRDSENVIDLLKELSLKGKLIFTVIHQPSSDIYKMFDKVFILDTGGYPIYYGNPIEAVIHFKKVSNQINSEKGQCNECGNVNPEQIFNIIEAKVVDEYGQETENRKIKPTEWYAHYTKVSKRDSIQHYNSAPPKSLHIPNIIKQWLVFTTRDVLSKLSNKQYLIINFLEAPVLALVLAFIIRYISNPDSNTYIFRENENIPAYLFMSIIVALFMGLTVSAEEIIRDRKILKREAFLNLSWGGYLSSKMGILFVISAIQTLSFVLIGNTMLGIKGLYLEYWVILFTVSCFANVLGLNISATFNSAVTIYILIPILLIPQMILSGAIFSFDKLNKLVGSRDKVPVVADFMASRWAFEALAVVQFSENKYQKSIYELEKLESKYDFKQAYLISELKDKLSRIRKNVNSADNRKKELAAKDLLVLKNELRKEAKSTRLFNASDFDNTTLGNFDKTTEAEINDVLEQIKNFYIEKFNTVNDEKDLVVSNMQTTEEEEIAYRELKNDYFNEGLSDLVRKVDAKKHFLELDGEIVQQKDPVFLNPAVTNSFLGYRTHFFAPLKICFGSKMKTFYFNLMAIVTMTLLLSIALYFESLKKFLTITDKISAIKNKLTPPK